MIACFIYFAALVGSLYNCRGLFYAAIAEAKGWKYSSLSFTSVIMGLCSVASLKMVPKLYRKYPMKWTMAITGALYAITYMLRAYMKSLVAFTILGAFMGVLSAFIVFVPLPIIINNWFIKSKGLALGFSALASGVGATVMSPILSNAIANWGWEKAAIFNGALALAIALPIIIIFIDGTPEEKGMIPYGADPDYKERQEKLEKLGGKIPSKYTDKEKKKRLVLCIVYATLAQLIAGLQVEFPNYVISLGFSIIVGGAMNSINNTGNMLGKAVGGICMDKVGLKNTLLGVLIITAIGFGCLIAGGIGETFMYLGAFIIGVAAVLSTVVPAALVDTFSKGTEYTDNMATVSLGTMLAASFVSYLPGLLKDLLGSYVPVFVLYIGFVVALVIIALTLLKDE